MDCYTTRSAFLAATANVEHVAIEERRESIIYVTAWNDSAVAIVAAARAVGLNFEEKMVAEGYRVVVSGFYQRTT